MITNMYKRKIVLVTLMLFVVFLIGIFPSTTSDDLVSGSEVKYVNTLSNSIPIFLADSYEYVALTNISIDENITKVEDKALYLVECLIIDGKYQNKLPSGFKATLPSGTQINSIKFINDVVHVDLKLDKEDMKDGYSSKIIESIVYTLTQIEEVKGVTIYIDGQALSDINKEYKETVLTREMGINKVYSIDSLSNISAVTVYFLGKTNDVEYYVPVTKYTNSSKSKIEVIVEELSAGALYEPKLMSYLNTHAKVINFDENSETLTVDFNEYIYNDINTETVLEEVTKSIFLSIDDNYDASNVVIKVNGKELLAKCFKTCN